LGRRVELFGQSPNGCPNIKFVSRKAGRVPKTEDLANTKEI